jgi:iron complex outermembrane receptor protein
VLSAGIGFRREEYELKAGEPLSWVVGDQPILDGPKAGQASPIGPGIRPDEAGEYARNVWGGYLGIEGDLTEKLKVGLTARRESYSDFGLTDTGKLSVRYDFTPTFALRSSLSTGYRAPGLGQIGFATSTTQPQSDGSILYTRTVPVGSPIANALGFPDLEPEKSKNVSAGFVWQPTSNSYLTFDAYRIDIDDKLIPTDNISGPLVRKILTDAGYGATSVVRVFTNAADTSTKGFDLAGKARFDYGTFGKLDLSLGYNVNVTKVKKLKSAPGLLGDLSVNTPVVTKLLEHQSPRSKIILGANWALDDWRAGVTATRYGSVKHIDLNNIESQDYWLDPQWVVNVHTSYDVTQDFTVTLGANNVFNSYPDRSPWFSATSPPTWSMITPDGFDGRFVYTNLSYRF